MTAEMKTFTLSYTVDSYYDVTVERPADISEEELIASITRAEFNTGYESGGEPKEAFRSQRVSLITDEEGEQLFN